MKKFFLLPIVGFILLLFGANPIYAIGEVGPGRNYLELNGGYVKATSEDPTSPPGFTFEAWIKPKTISGIQKILSIGDKAPGILHYEVFMNGAALGFKYNNGLGGDTSVSTGQLTAGAWQHIAVTISGQTTRLFINGQTVFAPQISHGSLLQIGHDVVLGDSFLGSWQTSKPYKGALDEVRISDIARDVSALWQSGDYDGDLLGDSSAIFMFRMNQTRGETTVVNSSSRGSDGMLIGGDNRIHFFGVLPSPTLFVFQPIQWTRPVLPTLSFPFPTISNPFPTSSQSPPENNPTPTSSIRDFPRLTRIPRGF